MAGGQVAVCIPRECTTGPGDETDSTLVNGDLRLRVF